MLGKENNYKEGHDPETIIGPSVKVKGNFVSQGNITIEGSLDGTLDTAGNVKIGTDAKVKANVSAKEVYIAGLVEGTIKVVEKIILASTAKIIGDIDTKTLIIEDGAYFSGKCTMGNDSKIKTNPTKNEEDTENTKK